MTDLAGIENLSNLKNLEMKGNTTLSNFDELSQLTNLRRVCADTVFEEYNREVLHFDTSEGCYVCT